MKNLLIAFIGILLTACKRKDPMAADGATLPVASAAVNSAVKLAASVTPNASDKSLTQTSSHDQIASVPLTWPDVNPLRLLGSRTALLNA